jgi:hypothetical protein
MKRKDPELEPELERLLRSPKATRRMPADMRARVLARSRAFVSGGQVIVRPDLFELSGAPPASASPRPALGRLALAASIAIVGGAAGALAAIGARPADVPRMAPPESSLSDQVPRRDQTINAAAAASMTADDRTVITKTHPARKRGAYLSGEIELLRRAQVAYQRRDFSSALALIAEHAHRFPKGPLAEEFEALRVESLVGSGHADKARRAGAIFLARFPRSVLLPRIEEALHDPE